MERHVSAPRPFSAGSGARLRCWSGVSLLLLSAGALAILLRSRRQRRWLRRRPDRRRRSPSWAPSRWSGGRARLGGVLLRRRHPAGRVLTLGAGPRQPARPAVRHGPRRLRALDPADQRRTPALRDRWRGYRPPGTNRTQRPVEWTYATPDRDAVLNALRVVVDPDLRRDIVSLGFVKDLVARRTAASRSPSS